MQAASNEKIQAVIFDLDDTLVSEYEFIVSGYRYMASELSPRLKHSAREIEQRFWELAHESYSRIFNRLFESYGETLEDEELTELVSSYRSHPADLGFYPDAKDTLTALKDMGILTGIISDGDPGRQRNKIATAIRRLESEVGLHNVNDGVSDETIHYWFDEIILNDEFGGPEFRKPDPTGFTEMASRLKISPSQMIYVGDNPKKDFHIASVLPVRTARIIRDNAIYSGMDYRDGVKETWHIDTLADLIPIVRKAGTT